MPYMLVQHTVEDYGKWKSVFDEHATARKTAGSKGGVVLRNADNPNQVTILLEIENLADARAFAGSCSITLASGLAFDFFSCVLLSQLLTFFYFPANPYSGQ